MEEIIKLIVDNGIGIVCVGYLIYFQSTTMKKIQENMADMVTTLVLIKDDIKELKKDVK